MEQQDLPRQGCCRTIIGQSNRHRQESRAMAYEFFYWPEI